MVQEDEQVSTSSSDKKNVACSIGSAALLIEPKGVFWSCSMKKICLSTLWLPLGTLLFCLVTATIFQADDIHETHCRVYNIIPSISAITGVSPQKYLWRMCIAFHLGPRLLAGSLYYTLHRERAIQIVDENKRRSAIKLGAACYWLNFTELLALAGVTYISNVENYFIHEKLFIIFMVSALTHMLCRAKVGSIASDEVEPVKTNHIIWTLFYVSIVSTFGLIIQFLRHRLLCRPLAFTWFSVCEYILTGANISFHALILEDFSTYQLQVSAGGKFKAN